VLGSGNNCFFYPLCFLYVLRLFFPSYSLRTFTVAEFKYIFPYAKLDDLVAKAW